VFRSRQCAWIHFHPSWARALTSNPSVFGSKQHARTHFHPSWTQAVTPKLNMFGSQLHTRTHFHPSWALAPYLSPTLTGKFFRGPIQVPQYFILIRYVLFWVEYNSKYLKGWNYTSDPHLHKKKKDSRAINTSWDLQNNCSQYITILTGYIFSEHLSSWYYYILSLYKINDFIIGEFSPPPEVTFCI